MRLIFSCAECQVRYLPPEGLRYGDGSAASAVWCSPCQGVMAARGVAEPEAFAAIALFAAVEAMKAAVAARDRAPEEAAADVRPSRPARTSRARSAPARGRSKLR